MKKFMLLALTLVSFQSAFAQMRQEPRRPDPRGPIGPGFPRDRDDLPMCLKNLENANRRTFDLERQLNVCIEESRRDPGRDGGGRRENEELRRENQRLNDSVLGLNVENRRLIEDNSRLLNDNTRFLGEIRDLRRQLDDILNPLPITLGYFSYAACKGQFGGNNLSQLVSAEGQFPLESETKAKQKIAATYNCSFGVAIVKTEEITSSRPVIYCVAGCKGQFGGINQNQLSSGTGRIDAEARYNVLKTLSATYTCSFGVEVQACQ